VKCPRVQVSINGGFLPRWRHDGKELFYLSPDKKIMSAEICEVGSNLVIGKVQPLFTANPAFSGFHVYDVTSDGKKFIIASRSARQAPEPPLTLVTNWPALLKK